MVRGFYPLLARAHRGLFYIGTGAIWVFTASFAYAQGAGDLLLSTTRLVFEADQKSAEIILKNIGASEATYRIFFVNQRMTREGALEAITEAVSPTGEKFADKLVRYAPRQVVLPAGASQTVRLQLRRPVGLEPGEYRSHLVFQSVPAQGGLSVKAPQPGERPTMHIQMVPVFAIAIPVIVRHGQTQAEVRMVEASVLQDDAGKPAELRLLLRRTGNRSVYGNLRVVYQAPDRKETELGMLNGIAVYTPNTEREVRIPLHWPEGQVMGGRISLTYTDDEASRGLLAQTSFPLNTK